MTDHKTNIRKFALDIRAFSYRNLNTFRTSNTVRIAPDPNIFTT
jgi:hypothetical protein